MIIGIGTDIVKISRVNAWYASKGTRLVTRVLTGSEQQSIQRLTCGHGSFIAKKLAAKEAFVKALGTGFGKGIYFNSIGIHHNALGQPMLHYNHKVADILQQLGIDNIQVSISDEQDYTIAFVVLENSNNNG